jgi:nucleoside-diphosphate-sugar epimerase
MSWVHVEDCAGLIAHVARRAPPLATLNLYTGAPVTQRAFVEGLARRSGLPVRRVSLDELEAQHGTPAREAFAFSARIGSIHAPLLAEYAPGHADLDGTLASLL